MIRRLAIRFAVALLAATPLAAQVDPFYLAIERDARAAALRGDAAEAARLYRIACFGMLDEPPRLGACSVRLALAQHAAGDRDGFRDTWSRLATVEERFQGLSRAEVGDADRRALAVAAAAWLESESLRAIPDLAALAAAPASGRGEAGRPRGGQPAPVSPPAAAAVEAPPEGPTDDAEATATNLEPPDAPASPADAGRELSVEELSRLEAARDLLSGAATRDQLAAAVAAVRPIADAVPEQAAVARLAGDLAYRIGDWPTCARYFRLAGAPGLDEALPRFYMAICLYETGASGEAAELLAPVAARLKPTPFVNDYLERILGPSSQP